MSTQKSNKNPWEPRNEREELLMSYRENKICLMHLDFIDRKKAGWDEENIKKLEIRITEDLIKTKRRLEMIDTTLYNTLLGIEVDE